MPTHANSLIGVFIVGRLLAEQAGLSPSQANQWAAVLMATGLSPASILLVSELARRDAVNQPVNTALATLQAGQAHMLELSRQTYQSVAEAQHLSRQALAAAQAAAQAAQQAANVVKTASELAAPAPRSAESVAMRAGTGAVDPHAAGAVAEAFLADVRQACMAVQTARQRITALTARLNALGRRVRRCLQRRTAG
jgi:hypothetical protein